MKSLIFTIPSKTFIAGEYLALQGGPALVVATEPRFKMRITEVPDSINPFHADSPAGKLWLKFEDYFSRFHFEYTDPHAGQGGFGGSTAEFAFLHIFYQLQDSAWTDAEMNYDLQLAWSNYRTLAATEKSTPSGADLIGQIQGQLTFFDKESGQIQKFSWSFSDLGFALIRTNNKLKTFEHLDQQPEFNPILARPAMALLHSGLVRVDSSDFLRGLDIFSKELIRQELVDPRTKSILEKIKHTAVLNAKGCGAMGVDVVLVVYNQDEATQVLEQLKNLDLNIVTTDHEISAGLTKDIEIVSQQQGRDL